MASFGESFVDAFAAGRQMRRQSEEDKKAERLRRELADAVKPGDVIGPRGAAAAYDAARFSTDAGVGIGNRPLADFQGAQPDAALSPPAQPPAPPAQGMRLAAQLAPEMAGRAGIVRPTGLAGGHPAPSPAPGMAAAAALPVAPLGSVAPPPDTVALPDPEKLVFYRDPLTGKGMAVEAGRERRATPADAATSMAAVYMANGDAAKAMALMGEAYDLRSKDFEAQQRTMRQAIISATTRYGGFTPQALTAIARSYNDQVDDGVTLLPSTGPDGKVAMGLSMGGSTPELWVDPATGGVSKQPVYADGAAIGSYINTLVSGDWGAFQANVQQFQMAKEAAARQSRQIDVQDRQVDVAERRAAMDERQWNEGAERRAADTDYVRANTGQAMASADRLAAQSAYEFGTDYNPALGARQPAVGQVIASALKDIPGVVITRAGVDTRRLPLSAPNTYHDQGAAVDFTLAPGAQRQAVEAAIKGKLGAGYEVVYHPQNNSFHVEPSPQWSGPGGAAATPARQFRSPAERDKAVTAAWADINRQLTAQQAAGMPPQELKALELSLKARYQEQTGANFGVPSPTALASGGAGGMAPSYVTDLRTKGTVPGVIEAALAKYPQMADDIAKLAGPEAIRAYRQRTASPPPAITRVPGGPAVRDTSLTGALGRAMDSAGRREGVATAQAAERWAREYGPRWVNMYRQATAPNGRPMTAGEMKELVRLYRSNDAFKRAVPPDMRKFLDRQIAAQQ